MDKENKVKIIKDKNGEIISIDIENFTPVKHGKDGKDGKDGKQGEQGIQGKTGLQGPQGKAGLSGTSGTSGKSVSPAVAKEVKKNTEHRKNTSLHFDSEEQKEDILDNLLRGGGGGRGIAGPPGADGTSGTSGVSGGGIDCLEVECDNRIIKTNINNPSGCDIKESGIGIDDNDNLLIPKGKRIIFNPCETCN